MIDQVSGLVRYVAARYIAVTVPAGVTLTVLVPEPTQYTSQIGTQLTLYTHLVLSGAMKGDGEFQLYGFDSEPERSMFLLLKSVSGVGGLAALRILAKGLDEVVNSIIRDEPDGLRVKGVGPKITKRIAADLKAKVEKAFVC